MINITIPYSLNFGYAMYITGDSALLGNWNTSKALRLQWNEYDIWEINLPLHQFQYKYFIAEYDSPRHVLWEAGSNRGFQHTEGVDIQDFWNHRSVEFQVYNPHQLQMFISGSCEGLGNYYRRVQMKSKKGLSKHKILLNVLEDQVLFYQYHLIAKKEYTSQMYILNLKCENNYIKNTLIIYSDGLKKIKSAIYQFNPNICYGYVPHDNYDFNVLKQANLKTIIEFCNSPDSETSKNIEKNDDFNYMVVNLSIFDENTLMQRLFKFIKSLIQKYNTIYICNNSLSHLKKYLSVYQRLLLHKN